jgi:hypothetical protein
MSKKEATKLKVPKRAPREGEGRPSKYRPEYCQRMLDYFSQAREIVKKVQSFGKYQDKEYLEFPTFQGFAAFEIGVTHQTLIAWCKDYPEFSEAYRACKDMQEQILVKGGLTKQYDSAFAKFILNSVSDTFKEKVVVEADAETKNIIKLAYALPPKNEGEE